ncbi:MAG: serine/threonine protein kinase [Leptolyngbyaceae cyanobacterium]
MDYQQGLLLKDGEYKIVAKQGEDRFSATYQAISFATDRNEIVTIKIGKYELSEIEDVDEDELFKEREDRRVVIDFEREADELAEFSHDLSQEYVVRFIEYFFDSGIQRPCTVLEYVDGETLSDVVNRDGVFSNMRAVNYVYQVALVLLEMHEVRLNHRAIAPHNIVRKNEKTAVLTDFGFSLEYLTDRTVNETRCWSEYAPPEQQEPTYMRTGPRLDVYALSATLYFLLTGIEPETSENRKRAIFENHPDPQIVNIKEKIVNKKLKKAILWGMQLERSRRPQSIEEWLKVFYPFKEEKQSLLVIAARWIIGLAAISIIFIIARRPPSAVNPPANNNNSRNTEVSPTNGSSRDNFVGEEEINLQELNFLVEQGLGAIRDFTRDQDEEKLRLTLQEFELNSPRYSGNKDFDDVFCELTRRYVGSVLVLSGAPGIARGIDKLETLTLILEDRYDLDSLPVDDVIAEEYRLVNNLLRQMSN